MPKNSIFVIAALALSSAAVGKQEYKRIPLPLSQGYYFLLPPQLSNDGHVLYMESCSSLPYNINVVLWSEKTGARIIGSYPPSRIGQVMLNDSGQVAAVLRTDDDSAPYKLSIWSEKDLWQDTSRFSGGISIIGFTSSGFVLGWNQQGTFFDSRAFGPQFVPALTSPYIAPRDVNDALVVTGALEVVCGPGQCWNSVRHAFRWTPSEGFKDLETRPGWTYQSVGLRTNRFGEIAGILFGPSDASIAIWSERQGWRRVPGLPGTLEEYVRINDRAQVIGRSGQKGSDGRPEGMRSFLSSAVDGLRDLGRLNPANSWTYAFDLNNHGEVVGRENATAFFWSNATGMVDLGPGEAQRINDKGIVVGTSSTGYCVWTR